jgi:hypothetical protein
VAATAALAAQAAQDSAVTVALIGTLGGLAVAIVGGVFTLLKAQVPQPDPSRYIPEASDALAAEIQRVKELRAEINELRGELRAERAENARLREEVDTWQLRSFEMGWRP